MSSVPIPESTRTAALAAFHPSQFGFQPFGVGWAREFDGLGHVVVARLGWQHAQLRAGAAPLSGERSDLDALELVVELQRHTWGMAAEELVPANVLAVLMESGGSILVAYHQQTGFTADGWLGFAISLGTNTGTLLSHMLGVRADARGRHDLGWYLKVLQGHEALQQGYRAVTWTFDPMRGANARLNLEKLGATVAELTIDKYGTLKSELYGAVPSDRFTATWDLLSPATALRLQLVAEGQYQPPAVAGIGQLPLATSDSVGTILEERPLRVGYRIPGDIDQLMREHPAGAIRWRREMREVLSQLLTTKSACIGRTIAHDPTAVSVSVTPSPYIVTGIATGFDDTGERQSVYLLRRKAQD